LPPAEVDNVHASTPVRTLTTASGSADHRRRTRSPCALFLGLRPVRPWRHAL